MGADSFSTYSVGLHNVGSYQVAGVPYITGSSTLGVGQEARFDFPLVTNRITIINHNSEDIRIHFNSTGSGDVVGGLHYIEFDSNEDSITMNIKCKEIYISAPGTNSGNASFRIFAEMTQINVGRMYALTGSGLTD